MFMVWPKIVMLVLFAVLTVLWFVFNQGGRPDAVRVRRTIVGVAVGVVAFGVAGFVHFGQFRDDAYVNYHDVYHYYFGSKYSEELGYTRLYHCTIVALDEINPNDHRFRKTIRSMIHYRHIGKRWYLDRPGICKDHFTKARWAEFVEDIRSYDYPDGRHRKVVGALSDKGYNATPVWDMIAHPISSALAPSPYGHLLLLSLLDPLLMAGALILAFFAFGWWGLVGGAMYFLGCYELTQTHIRGGFLRLDWLALSIASVALVRLDRHKLAGAALAWATMVRVFPAVFLFGLVARGGWKWHKTRVLPRKTAALLVAYAVTCAALFGATVVRTGGFEQWEEWGTKIDLHTSDFAPLRVGMKYVTMYDGETQSSDLVTPDGSRRWRPEIVTWKTSLHRSRLWLHISLLLLVLAGVGFAATRTRDPATAMVLSFPLVFFVFSPTFYYYSYLVMPAVVFASRATHTRLFVILTLLLVFAQLAVFGVFEAISFPYARHTGFAMVYLVLFVLCVGAMVGWRRELEEDLNT